MNKDTKQLITKISIGALVVLVVGVFIYAWTVISKESQLILQDEIKTFLNESYKNENVSSKSPLLGMLNYNFDNIETMSTDMLIYTNIMSSSEMNDIGIDNIYKGKFGLTKSMYIQSDRYLSNPNTNCYYYQDVLKKSGFNCASVCSKSDSAIRQSIMDNLQWPNVLPEDIDNYCVKNALYPIEVGGYFVNLSDVRTLFKSLTNKELTFDSKITSNKYYDYDAYLEEESLRLEDNIKEVTEVTSVKEKSNKIIAEYTALTDGNNTLEGKVTLGTDTGTYYLISNEINTSYNLN